MPFVRRKPSARRPRRKPTMVRRRYARPNPLPRAPTGSFATRVETISLPVTAGNVIDYGVSLATLPVNQKLASFYQYYRITSIQMRFKPNFDTYVSGGASGTGVLPYLYFLYDKSGSLGILNANQFEQCGAKPIRMDDKTILRKWKPSVRISSQALVDPIPMFKSTPWIPTHLGTGVLNDAIQHLGAVFYVSKSNPTDGQVYDVDVTVTVQYRKPFIESDVPE